MARVRRPGGPSDAPIPMSRGPSGVPVCASLSRATCDTWLVATGSEERIVTAAPDHLGALALARKVRARGVEGELLRAARRARVPTRFERDRGDGNSDHREFELLGMRAAKLGTGAGEPCRHRRCDRAGRLVRLSPARAQRLVERSLEAR